MENNKYKLLNASVKGDYKSTEEKISSMQLFDLVWLGNFNSVSLFITQLEENKIKLYDTIHPIALAACIHLARTKFHPKIAGIILSSMSEIERGKILRINIPEIITRPNI